MLSETALRTVREAPSATLILLLSPSMIKTAVPAKPAWAGGLTIPAGTFTLHLSPAAHAREHRMLATTLAVFVSSRERLAAFAATRIARHWAGTLPAGATIIVVLFALAVGILLLLRLSASERTSMRTVTVALVSLLLARLIRLIAPYSPGQQGYQPQR
jgi:hypothetical protein